jgi:hypothetical protein
VWQACKLDMASPKTVGLLSSLSNTCATMAGVVGVPLAAAVVDATDEWSNVFALLAFVFALGAAVFVTTGSAKRVL